MTKGFTLVAAAMAAALATTVAAAPVAEADARPALMAAHPERAVLQGVAWAGKRLVAVGERGLILLSDDAGKRWRQAQVPVSVTLTAVRFPSPQQGWAVGHFGLVLHSGDGGETWQTQLDGTQAARLALEAAEARAKEAGADAAAMARQLANARRLVADGPDKPFFDLHFEDERRGIVVGAYNLILRTEDGGKTWQSLASRVDNPGAQHLYAIRAGGGSLYLAGEQGLVLRSDDQGASFRRLATPYPGSYFTLAVNPAGEVVVAGLRGKAFRSADRGSTWEAIGLPAPVSVVASLVDGEGRLLLANQAGQVVASRDMGRSIAPLPLAPLPPVTSLAVLPDATLLATTLQGVAHPAPAPASLATR